jgi:Nucleoside 2-deoxyribosyltransferase like
MTYFEAPMEYDGAAPAVFLAGGITDCPDWQALVVGMLDDLPIAVLNPRRADFPIHDPGASAAQIDWEYRHLQRADVVLFWFPASSSPQPIALYELGAHAAGGKPIAVGVDSGYLRKADVQLQLEHVRPDVHVYSSLAYTVREARHLISLLRS